MGKPPYRLIGRSVVLGRTLAKYSIYFIHIGRRNGLLSLKKSEGKMSVTQYESILLKNSETLIRKKAQATRKPCTRYIHTMY